MAKGFTSAILLAGLGAILFSAKAIVVKLCYAHGADAATVLALRMLFSLPFFWSAVWWVSKTQNLDPVCRKDRFALIVLGFLGYYVSSYLDFLGLETITVGLERIILPDTRNCFSAVTVSTKQDNFEAAVDRNGRGLSRCNCCIRSGCSV